ncbi:MAG: hypothetical protein AABW58_02080 [Nanoarchaeota archaeon]
MKKQRKLKEKDKWFIDLHHNLSLKTSIFHNNSLTIFESLVKYLKEEKSFNFHEISLLLDRDERNIWTVYKNALKKGENEKKQ